MTDKLKSAFGDIRAEHSLKADTKEFLYGKLQERADKSRRRAASGKFAAALACVFVMILSGTFAYSIYITPIAYVDLDVNPSIELALNRFERVIGAYAYNDDGIDIISGLSVRHKTYGDALELLMDTISGQGYLQNGGLVAVTLQTDDKKREDKLLASIQSGIENYMNGHHQTAQIDVFPVSVDVRSDSHEQGVSPAKYLAIQELIAVDPTASMESCRGHSISEIKQLTWEHGNRHGAASNTTDSSAAASANGSGHHADNSYSQDANTADSQNVDSQQSESTPSQSQGGAHHGGGGNRHGNRHG